MSTDQIPPAPLKLSTQMRAVLRIVSTDEWLNDAVMPHIDLRADSICWEPIFKLAASSGHRAALRIAHILWTDQVAPGDQPFEEALGMGPELRQACVKALALRWGL